MMKLETFVAETLKEIIDGVAQAQTYYEGKGGSINPPNLTFNKNMGFQMWDHKTGRIVQMIDFDVAVITAEGMEAKGGVGVFVGPVAIGAQRQSDASNTSSSRIKFSVPILLPQG